MYVDENNILMKYLSLISISVKIFIQGELVGFWVCGRGEVDGG